MRFTKDERLMMISPSRTRNKWIRKVMKDHVIDDISLYEKYMPGRLDNPNREVWPPHTPNNMITPYFALDRSKYTKITVVRNPWERYTSYFDGLLEKPSHPFHKIAKEIDFTRFIKMAALGMTFFDIQPQMHFIADHKGELDYDRIFDFDDREGILNFLSDMGYSLHDEPVTQKEREWRAYYTPETIKIVDHLCQMEIRRFGYKFDK